MNSAVYQASAQALDNCAKEPIHRTPLIQDHGLLLACELESGCIAFASANAEQYLQRPMAQVLGCSIEEFVSAQSPGVMARLQAVTEGAPLSIDLKLKMPLGSHRHYEVAAHRSQRWVVIEILPASDAASDVDDRIQMESVVDGVGTLHNTHDLPEFLNQYATKTRTLSGYQRVIIYRFLPDWSGEVLAESVSPGNPVRFLGLRFPASDIPAQARALYRINLLRIIGDVHTEPVAIHAWHPEQVLDQSHSLLRSPSPMHLGYLRNMGVRATMTISLLKDGELWGMVSCHHDQSRTPPMQLRHITKMLCALVAETAIARIDAVVQKESADRALLLSSQLNRLAVARSSPGEFDEALGQTLESLMPVLKVQGYGVRIHGRTVLGPDVNAELLAYIDRKSAILRAGDRFLSTCLRNEPDFPSGQLEHWAGLMVVPIAGHPGSHLFLLRREMQKQVRWAGAPSDKTEVLVSGLQVLGPRTSFETWVQTVEGYSEPWDDFEEKSCHDIAANIAALQALIQAQLMRSELHMLGFCMERLNDMVVVTDTEGVDEPSPRIVYVNDAFIATTGYTREEVIGRSPRLLQGPGSDRAALDTIRSAMKAWQPATVELVNYRKDGTQYWVEIAMAPIADSTGWYTHWVAIERDITERKRAELDIQKLVFYDSLTGLPNRRMLIDRLRKAVSSLGRYGRNGALLFVDLDNFKDLNDTAGHHVGDELLRQVAVRLSAEVRSEDTVARLGGDEFVVMLEGLSPDTESAAAAAQQIAVKLIASLGRNFDLAGHSYATTASIGITLFLGSADGQSVEELLKQADIAMYQSKSAGRNAWRFYDPATQAALVARSALEIRLKDAVNQQHLEVHYQPIMDGQKQMVGAEALLRWNDVKRGWISPAEFIPIAENNGLIVSIGLWVLEQAARVLKGWASHPVRTHWTLAVNVSARQMRQADFVDSVLAVLQRVGCNPARLKLELTESLLQHDIDAAIAKMERLRNLGIQFSIDDFGTGYSSLAYLRRLPLSMLKIDRSFVMDIEHDAGDRAICKTVLALGKTLNLEVLAEGVETQEQFDFLRLEGCDRFQGYHLSRPLPLNQLEQFEQSPR